MRRDVWAAIAVGLALTAAAATSAHADAIYDACVQKGVTNLDYNDCGAAYLKRADVALNQAWRAAFALTDGKSKTALLDEQRAWIAFRDKSCLLWASGDYGREGEVLSFPACRGKVIEDRTRALKSLGSDLKPQ